ncbi:MAG: hypothetical protein U9Q66_00490, partial [Patescibacteria group bacterium]|nr:hypothetical protein [Patescibacteria group bacterium]
MNDIKRRELIDRVEEKDNIRIEVFTKHYGVAFDKTHNLWYLVQVDTNGYPLKFFENDEDVVKRVFSKYWETGRIFWDLLLS